VPANRGGHGIPKDVAIEELTAAGFRIKTTVNSWPQGDYLLLFEKKINQIIGPFAAGTAFTVFLSARSAGYH